MCMCEGQKPASNLWSLQIEGIAKTRATEGKKQHYKKKKKNQQQQPPRLKLLPAISIRSHASHIDALIKTYVPSLRTIL